MIDVGTQGNDHIMADKHHEQRRRIRYYLQPRLCGSAIFIPQSHTGPLV